MPDRNYLGLIGFCLAVAALASLFFVGSTEVVLPLPFLGVPAVILSLIALRTPPRRWASWGLAIGLFVCLYLPTIAMPWLRGR